MSSSVVLFSAALWISQGWQGRETETTAQFLGPKFSGVSQMLRTPSHAQELRAYHMYLLHRLSSVGCRWRWFDR